MIVRCGTIVIKNKILLSKECLEIPDQGITLIRGKNGAGKTLLVKKILSECKRDSIMAAMVDQSNSMILRRESVLVNIAMSYDKDTQEKVKSKIEELGLTDLLSRKASTLSGGEKRIIMLFRELLSKSVLLIIDEPTNDLSEKWCNIVVELMKQYAKDNSIIIVSHDEAFIALADRIFAVKDGEVERVF
ncbi:MAG: ABC-F family ATP-binding cassette domain-containing protein [Lachnospiraceae bacterium]|nr:ABC-F family ATP-binding cassette domain-containing protein [Lachnospiraceae bacterium]